MKGQITLFTQFVLLIFIVMIVILFIYQIISFDTAVQQQRISLEIRSSASEILDVLTTSKGCLTYEGNLTNYSLVMERVLDSRKLKQFRDNYTDMEPECARDYYYGWNITVESISTIAPEIAYLGPEEPAYSGRGFYMAGDGSNIWVFSYQGNTSVSIQEWNNGSWSTARSVMLGKHGKTVYRTNNVSVYRVTSDKPVSVLQTVMESDFDSQMPGSGLLQYNVLWYKFDSAIKPVQDYSGNGHPGTVHGATWTLNGKIGGAYVFDGNDYIDLGDVLDPASNSWTTCLWFNWDGTTGENILYNKESLYELKVDGGYLQYAWEPNWAWYGGESFPVQAGSWYHVCIKYDRAVDIQYMYRNGVMVYSRSQSGDMGSNSNYLLIGARGSSSPRSYFHGIIDDVRIYDHAISPDEIRTFYSGELLDFEAYNYYGRDFYALAEKTLIFNGYYNNTNVMVTDLSDRDSDAMIYLDRGQGKRVDGFDYDIVKVSSNFPVSVTSLGSYGLMEVISSNQKEFFFPSLGEILVLATEDGTHVRMEDLEGGEVLGINVIAGKKEFVLDRGQTGTMVSFIPEKLDEFQWARMVSDKPVKVFTYKIKGSSVITSGRTGIGSSYAIPKGWGFEVVPANEDAHVVLSDNSSVLDEFDVMNGEKHVNLQTNSTFYINASKPVYARTFSVPQLLQPALLYHLDKNTYHGEDETHVHDFSGNDNEGTVKGGATWTSDGKILGAYVFDGINDYIQVSNRPSLMGFDGITLEAWIYINKIQPNMAVIGRDWDLFGMMIYNSGRNLMFCKTGKTSGYTCADVNYNFEEKRWYHLVTTWSSQTISFYIDGDLKRTLTDSKYDAAIGSGGRKEKDFSIGIGHMGWFSDYFNGIIDEVKIYNHALSGDEIKGFFQTGSIVERTDPVFAVPDVGADRPVVSEEDIWVQDKYYADFYGPSGQGSLTQNLQRYGIVVIGSDYLSHGVPDYARISDWVSRGNHLVIMGNDFSSLSAFPGLGITGWGEAPGNAWNIMNGSHPIFQPPADEGYLKGHISDGNSYWSYFVPNASWDVLADIPGGPAGNALVAMRSVANGSIIISASQPKYTGAIEHLDNIIKYLAGAFREEEDVWHFGSRVFSEKDALGGKIQLSIPVTIAYAPNELKPAKMSISIADGGMEKMAGTIDRMCTGVGGIFYIELDIKYPTYVKKEGDVNRLCLDYGTKISCRPLACKKNISMEKAMPGMRRFMFGSTEDEVVVTS